MKAYFTRLFNYDQQVSLLIVKTIFEASSPEKPVQLMAHLLAAQQIWLGRCKSEIANVKLWPDWKADTFEAIIQQNHQQWRNFLDDPEELEFNKIVPYLNSKGVNYTNNLSDIITHVINHGTHHRAQIGQHLKLAGIITLPITDYIAFVR